MKPELFIDLNGPDGNVFMVIGKAARVLRKAGLEEEAEEMQERLPNCDSYEDALNMVREYVELYEM